MKVGDLINFESKSWVMERDYANPGLILKDVSGASTERYRIVWSDRRVTVEHVCYLVLVAEG